MDTRRFDELTRAVAKSTFGLLPARPNRQKLATREPVPFHQRASRGVAGGSRRDVLRLLAALPIAGGVVSRLTGPAAAKRRRKPAQPEIVGGHPIPQGTFPFMAYIENEIYACGGSVIAPGFVLTAAHCTGPDEGHEPPFPPEDYFVGVGQVNLNRLGPQNGFGVVAVHRHPQWDPDTSQAYDVAVLQLDRPVPPDIGLPVDFVGSNDTRLDGAGQPVEVAGWGTIFSGGPSSSILLGADLNIVSDPDCEAAYGPSFDEQNMICAAFPGRDSCQGDSGGPLFANEQIGERVERRKVGRKCKKKRNGKKRCKPKYRKVKVPIFGQTQVGIVSFGQGCAEPLFPGVYARISDPGINNFITGVLGG